MNIKLSGNMVNFYSPEKESPIYYFKRNELAHSKIVDGIEISEWIEHLQNKKWMGKFDLYNLAVLIQKEYPKTTINWKAAFYPIEKQNFIDELFEEYQRSLQSKAEKEKSILNTLYIKMELDSGFEKAGKAEVLENLKNNLEQFGLIKR